MVVMNASLGKAIFRYLLAGVLSCAPIAVMGVTPTPSSKDAAQTMKACMYYTAFDDWRHAATACFAAYTTLQDSFGASVSNFSKYNRCRYYVASVSFLFFAGEANMKRGNTATGAEELGKAILLATDYRYHGGCDAESNRALQVVVGSAQEMKSAMSQGGHN